MENEPLIGEPPEVDLSRPVAGTIRWRVKASAAPTTPRR